MGVGVGVGVGVGDAVALVTGLGVTLPPPPHPTAAMPNADAQAIRNSACLKASSLHTDSVRFKKIFETYDSTMYRQAGKQTSG